MKIVVLAGGGGTRLFPLSGPLMPKQFLPLASDKPLIIDTIERFLSGCSQPDITVVTGDRYRELTVSALEKYGLGGVNIAYEPCAKSTAPAIALAIAYIKEKLKVGGSEPVLAVPSDHVIEPLDAYLNAVRLALGEAQNGGLVTIGITPHLPDTGFGYIMSSQDAASVKKVLAFKEKPDLKTAKSYLKAGNYYWNAGMYAFTVAGFEEELKAHAPVLFDFYSKGYSALVAAFPGLQGTSIDYAVAEKTKNISVVPMNANWSDIGSWEAYYEFCKKDANGNAIVGQVAYENCKNCLLVGSKELKVSDLSNIIVVQGMYATLVRGRKKL